MSDDWKVQGNCATCGQPITGGSFTMRSDGHLLGGGHGTLHHAACVEPESLRAQLAEVTRDKLLAEGNAMALAGLLENARKNQAAAMCLSDVAARERDAAIKERDEARATLARLRAHCQVEGAAPKNYHCEHRECCWCGAGAGQ
jgi:hypothetical protein